MREPRLYVLDPDSIARGLATDIYFARCREILERKGLCSTRVRYEIHCYGLPKGYRWGVFAGLEEALYILKGKNVDVYAIPEGTLFREYYPLMVIEGEVCEVIQLETAILGVLRFYTSVATKAARIRKVAGDKLVLFFGLRAQHPAIAPALDRAAYIGGVDAVSGVPARELLGLEPKGTMPHVYIIVFGDPVEAWKAFDEVVPPDVPRIALVDTFFDERHEALMAARALGPRLWGVRLDTPKSRRGDMRMIVEEVRWALRIHGYDNVKIVVSGGINEEQLARLRDVADAFGVGTSIACPPPIDLSMDVVEIYRDGKWVPMAKRGKWPGMKQVYRCRPIVEDYLDSPGKRIVCSDGSEARPLLEKVIEGGKLVKDLPSLEEIRSYVLEQLKQVEL
ncbi:MAG: nicotinate phosphoribosyltransferase [Crenarchaeota archaeon]|nr:nicotinate phosphoribosyltransferase [Thermoproteota archaeon]